MIVRAVFPEAQYVLQDMLLRQNMYISMGFEKDGLKDHSWIKFSVVR